MMLREFRYPMSTVWVMLIVAAALVFRVADVGF